MNPRAQFFHIPLPLLTYKHPPNSSGPLLALLSLRRSPCSSVLSTTPIFASRSSFLLTLHSKSTFALGI